jgi:hypothetical protein
MSAGCQMAVHAANNELASEPTKKVGKSARL